MIVNINGEKDPERLINDPVLKKIPQALKNIAIQRYHESTSE